MRRTDRLFELIQICRDGRLHVARDLAERLEVSVRTIYRDIDTLVASGVPIEGERGLGYVLRARVFLPPLNLTEAEHEALHLALSMLEHAADAAVVQAGRSLAMKLDDAGTGRPRRRFPATVHAMGDGAGNPIGGLAHLAPLRGAVTNRHIVSLHYRTADGVRSVRSTRPLELEFWGHAWTLAAWCELRADFRTFRLDRIERVEVTGARFADEPGRTLQNYLEAMSSGP